MRNTETGEFELVVGNKQLLSAFFIIVLLCAVAFVMGYVLGENSRSKGNTELASTPPVAVTAPDVRPQAAAPVPAPQTPSQPAESSAQPSAETQPGLATQPARELQTQAPPLSTPAASAPAAAAGGSYWQITATSNKDSAQDLLQTLQHKGFPATLRTDGNNLIHVLVGPYSDKQSFAKAKTDLENAGMPTPIAK